MFDAVTDVLSQNTISHLKTIRIVIFQPPMLKEFYNSMHQREQSNVPKPNNKGWFWGTIGSLKCKYREENNFGVLVPFMHNLF